MAENIDVTTLEPEVLSPRQQQAQERQRTLTTAVGLVQQGMTFRQAAEATGIARSTLWEAWQSLVGPDAVDRDERRKQADESLMAGSYAVATAGLARMAQEINQVDHRTLTGWVGMASNNVSRLRGWDRGGLGEHQPGEQIANVLERLADLGGVRVSLEVERIDRQGETVDDAQPSTATIPDPEAVE